MGWAISPTLGLVALVGCIGTNVVLDHHAEVRRVEVTAQPMKGALDVLVAIVVDDGDHLLEQG
jgi:hypothetical protein